MTSKLSGRFAPSPSASLHLGNLRTALIAWLFARSEGGRFILRVEDLDQQSAREVHVRSAIADLSALGLDWDGEIVRQSDRGERYAQIVDRLSENEMTFPCYCSRREILAEVADSVTAPHGNSVRAYPGTCRDLDRIGRARREREGRRPALRLRADGLERDFEDRFRGTVTGVLDDFVVRRADGVPAYNLAVVVDDHDQGITEIVRGDDLLETTPRQVLLGEMSGFDRPRYAHVPLAVDSEGRRLAKRNGAVTLDDQRARGSSPAQVLTLLAHSLDLAGEDEPVTIGMLRERFDPDRLPRRPWVVPPTVLGGVD